jgi:hypothetical protein
MSEENLPVWLQRRQVRTDQIDRLIAEARAQIKRADVRLEQLRMQPVGRRIRSFFQDLTPAR